MPIDFLQQQALARKQTRRLVLYFGLSVMMIVAAVYLVVMISLEFALHSKHLLEALNEGGAARWGNILWRPALFLWVSVVTLTVVIAGSLIKISELSQGGGPLAMRMGGRLLDSNPTDPDEKKLLNVVEEMAIASGIPVPQVYLLKDEQGINAFAAGHSPQDAVIGVTRGCMKLLTRDELQGVIGHEFSHILNGDMRLNMRLMGWVYGILCLTIIGKMLLNTGGDKNRSALFGLALIAIGGSGAFFGRLIQSAVSRQREFLADASAVQFTRNPDGLGGALKKIGGLPAGSRLSTDYANEAGHLFFGNALGAAWIGWLATHPPLTERVRRIDPAFDGKFPRIVIDQEETPVSSREQAQSMPPFQIPWVFGAAASMARSVPAGDAFSQVNMPLPQHLTRARGMLAALPESLTQAAREPFDANALIYAMLLSPDDPVRAAQMKSLEMPGTEALMDTTAKLYPALAGVERDSRLALAALAMPALRRLTSAQYDTFSRGVRCLVEADQQIDLFEYALQKMLRRQLDPQFAPGPKTVVQFYVIKPLVPDCVVLLSALAHVGRQEGSLTLAAFQAGTARLGPVASGLALLDGDPCSLSQVDQALERLGEASPRLKLSVLEACAQTVASDGVLQPDETALLRAIADTLDCPVPPFVEASAA